MPSPESPSVDRALRFEAARHLRGTENIRSALLWISRNPDALQERVTEFDRACQLLNSVLGASLDFTYYIRGNYQGVIDLQEALQGQPISPLRHLVRDDQTSTEFAYQTFHEIQTKIISGEWEFPKKVTDPQKLVSAMLIEGYGLFLEKKHNTPGLARKFIVAFEEVLWNEYQGSKILNEVQPWMEKEAEQGEFAPEVKRALQRAAADRKERETLAKFNFLARFLSGSVQCPKMWEEEILQTSQEMRNILREKFGEHWETACIIPLVAMNAGMNFSFQPDELERKIFENLFLLGYEAGSVEALSPVMKRVTKQVGTIENRDSNQQRKHLSLASIGGAINAGAMVKVNSTPDLPAAIREFIQGLNLNLESS